MGYDQSLYNLKDMKIDPRRLGYLERSNYKLKRGLQGRPFSQSGDAVQEDLGEGERGIKEYIQENMFRVVVRKNFEKKVAKRDISFREAVEHLKNQKNISKKKTTLEKERSFEYLMDEEKKNYIQEQIRKGHRMSRLYFKLCLGMEKESFEFFLRDEEGVELVAESKTGVIYFKDEGSGGLKQD